MKSPIRIALAGGALVALLAAGGVYAYFFSGLRSTPPPLALSTTTPRPAASATAAAGLNGPWKVSAGSEAGFRVGEVFAGQSSRHEAVVRSKTVSGGLQATSGAGGYTVTDLSVTVATSDLTSQDTVAGLNVSQRDRIISGQLATGQFPSATFTATSVIVPATLDTGQVMVSVPGKLTIHGVTRDVTASLQAQRAGDGIEAVGTIPIVMSDYGVQAPRLPVASVESGVTVEFKIGLARA